MDNWNGEALDAFKKHMRHRELNDQLAADRKEMDRDYDAKFGGMGIAYHSTGDHGHFPWLWEA